ncbi:MAG: carboxypeptidase-like regulatory domain-containing protein [Acidobacteriota bacterium]
MSKRKPGRCALSGVVTDDGNGRGVQNARVEILDGPYAARSTQTDAAGAYRIADIVAGRITIRVTQASFESADRPVSSFCLGARTGPIFRRKSSSEGRRERMPA